MFCPQCGQPQPAEAARFCKRCGMALESLAQFVESGGQLSPAGETRDLTRQQRGTRMGLMLVASGLIFGVVAAILTMVKNDLFVFFPVAAVVFMVGVVRLLYALLLEEGAPPGPRPALRGGAARPAVKSATHATLPPARTVPIQAHTYPGADTKDMADPRPSVTEQTTKLLEEE